MIGLESSGLEGIAAAFIGLADFLADFDFPFWALALKQISDIRIKELKALVFTVFLVSFFEKI